MEDEQVQQTQPGNQNQMKMMLPILGIVVIGILGFALLRKPSSSTEQTAPATTQQVEQTTTASPATTTTGSETVSYKKGEYNVVGEYTSPGGQEELGVTLTIDGVGTIVSADVEVKATRPISKTRQEDFAANYKSSVVGKNISDLSLGKISGSSLTPKGFNDALEKIKAEAKS